MGSLVALAAFFVLIFATAFYQGSYQREKQLADQSSFIIGNMLINKELINVVMERNRDDIQRIVSEQKSASSDIQKSIASDDCADRLVPVAGADRLREYAHSLR